MIIHLLYTIHMHHYNKKDTQKVLSNAIITTQHYDANPVFI
jgi:hypothetical protein